MYLLWLELTLDVESEVFVMLVFVTMGRKVSTRDFLCDKYRLLVNGYKMTFKYFVGGDMDVYENTPFGLLVVSICTCDVLFKETSLLVW